MLAAMRPLALRLVASSGRGVATTRGVATAVSPGSFVLSAEVIHPALVEVEIESIRKMLARAAQ